jgi:hypothetical protein
VEHAVDLQKPTESGSSPAIRLRARIVLADGYKLFAEACSSLIELAGPKKQQNKIPYSAAA